MIFTESAKMSGKKNNAFSTEGTSSIVIITKTEPKITRNISWDLKENNIV